MQALTFSEDMYQDGPFAEASRNILAHLEAEDGHAFGVFEQAANTPSRHSAQSKKGRNDLSITVPRNPTGKSVVATPDTANTPVSPPNITVESRPDMCDATTDGPAQRMALQTEQAPQADNAGESIQAVNLPLARTGAVNTAPLKKKKSHARKQAEGHIPRPRNAFILFRKHITDNNLIPKSVEVKHQNISIVASKMWAEAPAAVKAQFTEAAKKEKEEHARLYPNYRYQPAYRRTDIIRRRVRKDPLEDDKCEAVATLLIQGKGGNALEAEVKEKIAEKTGQPEIAEDINLVVKRGRRKRKDAPGELSKGAIRAQKAAERARAMREHWMDTSMLLAQQAHSHVHHRMAPPTYYDEGYHQPNMVYVDEFGRQVYPDDGYDLPYDDGQDGDYFPVDHHPNGMVLGQPMQDHYGDGNMRLPRVDTQHPFNINFPAGVEQQVIMEQAPMYDHNAMYEQNMQYVAQHPTEVAQQWGMGEGHDLLPFEPQAVQAREDPFPMHMQMTQNVEQDPATYALDPMLAPNAMNQGHSDAYARNAHGETNITGFDEYRNISMPSDIIAGHWAREQNLSNEDHQGQGNDGNDHQRSEGGNLGNLLPLMEGEHLPTQHIDFGDKGELFGGDLNEVLPVDHDIEDYNAALHQQQDMEGLLGQF